MLNNFKLTGTIHDDITTVCEAIEYTKSLIDGLVEESDESCAESDINQDPDFVALCEYHDRWMEEEENKVINGELSF